MDSESRGRLRAVLDVEDSAGLATFSLVGGKTRTDEGGSSRHTLQLLVKNEEPVSSILQRVLPSLPSGTVEHEGLTPSECAGRLRLVSTQHGRVRRLYAVRRPKRLVARAPSKLRRSLALL